MSKGKKITLRQRLRAAAKRELDRLEGKACEAVAEIVEGTSIDYYSLMKLASTNQGKSLRTELITALANDAEAELEAIYNKQMALIEDDADGK